jgi:hypothetical protein
MTRMHDELRRICAHVLSGREFDPALLLDSRCLNELVEMAEFEGVLPLLDSRLRQSPCWDALPSEFREALVDGARAAAMQEMFRAHELRRISAELKRHDLSALALKGNALGLWLYPKRYLRVTSDIDLLFTSREEVNRAAEALTELGYVPEPDSGRSHFERKCKMTVDGSIRSELDLHSRLLNSPVYADLFGFDALLASAITLPGLEEDVKGLGPDHALAHACLNRALDMQTGAPDALKLLYDVHLLTELMDHHAWDLFTVIARSKGICGVCLRTFEDTVAALQSPIPIAVIDELRTIAKDESLDWRRLDDWRYMQWQNLKALPDIRARLHWLWDRLFPTNTQLRELHGDGDSLQLMGRRLLRGIGRLRG